MLLSILCYAALIPSPNGKFMYLSLILLFWDCSLRLRLLQSSLLLYCIGRQLRDDDFCTFISSRRGRSNDLLLTIVVRQTLLILSSIEWNAQVFLFSFFRRTMIFHITNVTSWLPLLSSLETQQSLIFTKIPRDRVNCEGSNQTSESRDQFASARAKNIPGLAGRSLVEVVNLLVKYAQNTDLNCRKSECSLSNPLFVMYFSVNNKSNRERQHHARACRAMPYSNWTVTEAIVYSIEWELRSPSCSFEEEPTTLPTL